MRGLPGVCRPNVEDMAQVLIVEDDAQIRAALVRALKDLHHVTMTASTAMDGLQLVVEASPDVMLLDLGLPDLDGSSLLAMIRAVSRFRSS